MLISEGVRREVCLRRRQRLHLSRTCCPPAAQAKIRTRDAEEHAKSTAQYSRWATRITDGEVELAIIFESDEGLRHFGVLLVVLNVFLVHGLRPQHHHTSIYLLSLSQVAEYRGTRGVDL